MIEGEGSLTAEGNVKVGDEVYEAEARRPRHRLGGAADPRASSSAAASLDTWGAWSLPEQPKKIAVVGAGASGSEIASAYAPLRHRGDPDRDARPDPPRRGQGHRQGRRTRLQETGHRDLHRRAGGERRGRRGLGQVHLRRQVGRGRLPLRRRRPRPRRRGRWASRRRGSSSRRTAKIKVDEYQRTTNPKVFAIGDLVNKKALAHKAAEEGVVAVETRGRRRDPPGRPGAAGRRHLQPPAGRQRRPHRGGRQGGRATRSRSANRKSPARARAPSTTTKTASSSSSSTPSTARSSAPTSSATAPAT